MRASCEFQQRYSHLEVLLTRGLNGAGCLYGPCQSGPAGFPRLVRLSLTGHNGDSLGTLGVEYSYRINERWSVGGVVERADRESDSTLVIAFAHFWPYKGLYLGAGVGRKDPGEKRENTARVTIGYEFEFGKGWAISPQANVDFIENEDTEEVYGLVFGKQF